MRRASRGTADYRLASLLLVMRHGQDVGAAESWPLSRPPISRRWFEGGFWRGEMSMQTRYDLSALFLLVLLGAATAADGQVQPQLAQRYFEEAKTLCERDAGRLWGVSLCGPLVIVDQATGTRATSQPEPEGPPPRFRVSRTAPSPGADCGGSACPCTCSRRRMPIYASNFCFTGCSIAFSPSWGS